ncbi:MAG: amidohydrolase [Candidatus Margulisbacteria bacterium]|nr:amidohydrolase [Candidatus Margulisiibacteriota bacterium]
MATNDKVIFGGTIYTMEGESPQAVEAVVVKEDRIVYAGTKAEAMKVMGDTVPGFDLKGTTMFPGFIDPHLHPAAIAFLYYSITIRADEDWGLPDLKINPVIGHDEFLDALIKAERQLKDPDEWLIVSGYASYYHGQIGRADLEKISSTRPIALFQRCLHEAFLNGKAMESFGVTAENAKQEYDIDYPNGHFVEAACIEFLWPRLIGIIMPGDRWKKALGYAVEYLHQNGITTIMDPLAFDGFTKEQQQQFLQVFDAPDIPFRTYMVAEPRLAFEKGGADAAVAYVDGLSKKDGNNIKYMKAAKGFVDGAFFAQLFRMKGGFTDGHQGVWITPPDELGEIMTIFWNKYYPIHIHVQGDEGIDSIINTFAKLKQDNPQSTSRVTFHHLATPTPDQIKTMKQMDIHASLLPYYLHALGDIYSTHGLTPEVAQNLTPAASFFKAGIITSLHSDFFMAPSNPLYSAWCAATRIGAISGKVLAPEERLTVFQALQGITINAADTFGMENEIGSIKAGKKADFTILAEDPFKVDPVKMKDIKIVGKVFNGKYYTLAKQ